MATSPDWFISVPAGNRAVADTARRLEITEGVLVEDFARGLSILRRLKALGVRIAMDDFWHRIFVDVLFAVVPVRPRSRSISRLYRR